MLLHILQSHAAERQLQEIGNIGEFVALQNLDTLGMGLLAEINGVVAHQRQELDDAGMPRKLRPEFSEHVGLAIAV